VIEMPRMLWLAILHGIILRVRPSRSAKAYRQVWTEQGSPLLDISRRQAAALQQALEAGDDPQPVNVALAMRYGSPSIREALQELRAAGARRILVLPMYPQYSATTTASVFDAVTRELQQWRWVPEMRFINQYHDDPGYVRALADTIRRYRDGHGTSDKLLFSFHGIPKDYFLNGDPYYCHCQKTARLVAENLGLAEDQWQLGFQSRVGAKEWLKPYTDHILKDWGGAGVGSVQVVCPGFSADCLETLEEIAVENRDYFLGAGGGSYGYIPALNDEPQHIEALAGLVNRHLQGWEAVQDAPGRLARAQALGAER
jgi:ferrochelatase